MSIPTIAVAGITIKRLPIKKIDRSDYNPRKLLQPEDPEYLKLQRSIETFGYVDPLIWNKRTKRLVGGHQRLSILEATGIKSVDVSVVDLDDLHEKALNVALNKIEGSWNEQALQRLLAELDDASDFDETLTGFDAKELADLIQSADEEMAEDLPDTSGCAELGIIIGDCQTELRKLPANSVHCVVTSPPYWALRDYGTAEWVGGDPRCPHKPKVVKSMSKSTLSGTKTQEEAAVFKGVCGRCGARRIDEQLGLEATPEEHVAKMVAVFEEVKRVLRPDGTLFLNYGDSYAQLASGSGAPNSAKGKKPISFRGKAYHGQENPRSAVSGIKPKDLIGMPWTLAFALRDAGWYLRSPIVWAKLNPMPEPVSGRPTKSYEHVFLLTKSERYFYDAEAVREPSKGPWNSKKSFGTTRKKQAKMSKADLARQRTQFASETHHEDVEQGGRHLRDVWLIATQPMGEDHFASYPEKLVEPCLKSGAPLECCPYCGAPPPDKLIELCLTAGATVSCCSGCGTGWRRILEISSGATGMGFHKDDDDPMKVGHSARSETTDGTYARKTKGFLPGCDCERAPAIPGTVLDPFCGTGTTGVVARRLGLSFIGIELNRKYAAMASRRISAIDGPPITKPLSKPVKRKKIESKKKKRTAKRGPAIGGPSMAEIRRRAIAARSRR